MGSKKLTEKEERKLVEEYLDGISSEVLAKKYGFKTKKSIIDKVKKYAGTQAIEEVRNKKKSYKIPFDGVTSNFNAYFLGLMLTDGYVADGNKFGIDLTDEDCIKFLSDVMQKEYKTYSSNDIGKKDRHRLIFSDNTSLKNLAKYGVVKNKSKILRAVTLTEDEEVFLPFLIRGIIDGDGCIYKTSYGAPAFYICSGSKDFIVWLDKIFKTKFFFQDLHISKNKEDVWRLDSANQLNILKLISLVYNCPYGMNRKYKLIRKLFRDYNGDNLLLG